MLTEPQQDSAVLIAENDQGEPLGFTLLYWYPAERGAFVKDLAVSAEAEGHGVGRFLMEAIVGWAHERRAVEIMLKTTWDNTRARAFYAQAGFQEDHLALVRRLD